MGVGRRGRRCMSKLLAPVSNFHTPAATVGPVTPPDIPDLLAWFDADQLVLSDNDPVSTWTDASGNGNDATGSGGSRPTYKTGILNGLPVVRFDATDDVLATAMFIDDPTEYTILVVYNHTTSSGNHRVIQGSNNWLIGGYSGAHRFYNGAFIIGPAVSANVFVKAIAFFGGGTAEFRVNGSSQGTNGNTTGPGTIYIGAGGTSPGEKLDGDVAEICVYDRKLTTDELTDLESYVTDKYGV